MPRYRENPLIIPFSMLCPGISQNTKLQHLTLYKGQVWGEKSYLELCNHQALTVVFDISLVYPSLERYRELYVPPGPGLGFFWDFSSQIPYDSEILQSFAELTNITTIKLQTFDAYGDSLEDVTYQLKVGSYMCYSYNHKEQCAPPYGYYPFYIWTKEGYKYTNIRIQIFRFKKIIFTFFHISNPPPPQYPPQGSRIANLFGLFDPLCWAMVFLTWLIVWHTFKLLEYIAEKMGHTFEEVEIPFLPFR